MHATFPSSDRLEPLGLAGDEGPFLEPLPPERKRWPWHLLVLVILTALAGVSRFYRLDQPPIWGDEASTFRRVSGTYEEMLDTLERDPFGPIFYEIEWAVRQYHHLTPFWLRFFPALFGTLMVPAMYFLARQMAGIRTALVAAMFTLCSAWMINYGRDAKMYMTFWLFCALSAGCFLWWARTRTWTAWLSWIAASCAMVGVNPWGTIILALTPIWLLTSRRMHWAMGVGWVVGILVILIGPVGYFQIFNHWRDKTEENGHFSDINWVRDRNENATGLDLVQDSTAAFLYSFTFVQESAGNPEAPRAVLIRSTIVLTTMVTLFALGALPWRRLHGVPASAGMEVDPETGMPCGLKPARRWALISSPSSPEPWWRPTLWLSLWILLPTYLFYCMSVRHPVSPADWVTMSIDSIGGHVWTFVVLILLVTALVLWLPCAANLLLDVVILAAAIALLIAFKRTYAIDIPDADKWHRPIDALSLWPRLFVDPRGPAEEYGRITWLLLSCLRVLWAMIVIVPAVAIARASRTYRGRVGQLIITGLVVLVVGVALQQIFIACTAAKDQMRANGVMPSSIWVPRYLGFIWPAVAIAAAALLCRLPTWPVRWIAILAVCGVNLYVANHRVLGHTEPPLDRIVADIHAGEQSTSPVRTYVQSGQAGGGPGGGSLSGAVGKYYMLHDRADLTLSPEIFSDWEQNDQLLVHSVESPNRIAATAKREPWVNKIIVWRPIYRNESATAQNQDILRPPMDQDDPLLQKLGDGWQRTSDEIIPICYHWSWAERYLYRRREFQKLPTTAVEASPASQLVSTTRP